MHGRGRAHHLDMPITCRAPLVCRSKINRVLSMASASALDATSKHAMAADAMEWTSTASPMNRAHAKTKVGTHCHRVFKRR